MNSPMPFFYKLNSAVRDLFRDALKVTLKNPGQGLFFLRTFLWQRRAIARRLRWERQGLHVPPFLIFSITSQCNLSCKGCYAKAHKRTARPEMKESKVVSVIREADELGISIVLVAGGEPLTRPDFFRITAQFPHIIFPVFTNGLLVDEAAISEFKRQKNVVPVFSIEGLEQETDQRRGQGVYEHILQTLGRMKGSSIFNGVSVTVTSANYRLVTEQRFIGSMVGSGCKLFFFIEYIPVQQGTDVLVLSEEQRRETDRNIQELRRRYPALFISFPGDEEDFGGCLAAGRGFVHISADGSVEPCPFSPYSDAHLSELTLREALHSKLLRSIRENHYNLTETRGGCALWENREWVESLVPVRESESIPSPETGIKCPSYKLFT